MSDAQLMAFRANVAGLGMPDPVKLAALTAGQSIVVAHIAAHDLGAASNPIRAVGASVPADEAVLARAKEHQWQRDRVPSTVCELEVEDQRNRSPICWQVFGGCCPSCFT